METVDHIVEAFNPAEDAIGEKDLDALMMVYSEHYRYQDLTKADMRNIWKGFLEQYDRVTTLHSFSRSIVKPGKSRTAQITCTGALWATSNRTDQRVNLSSWGDVHCLIYEHGAWRIVGQGRNAPSRSEFGQAPPPMFQVSSVKVHDRVVDTDELTHRVRTIQFLDGSPSQMLL